MLFDIYKNKKVFVTGHTGFKGSWLSLWLSKLGAIVCGYSLNPNTYPSMYEELQIEKKIEKSIVGDILNENKLFEAINDFQPDIIFHLAAQPLVRLSYFEPVLTYKTNVIGTLNVLEAARKCYSVKALVNVTTDKCYENKETFEGYKEADPMGGYDMYSSSKGCVEIMSSSYRRSFLSESGYALATARAGNVVGGGDWAEDRLIPDFIRSVNKGEKIKLRNPNSVRPWQFVLEPLSGYLKLGEKLLNGGKKYAQAYNFAPNETEITTVSEVISKFINFYGKGEFVCEKKDGLHEANLLLLNTDKARKEINWNPVYGIDKTIETTAQWYREFYRDTKNMYKFTIKQIEEYEDCIC